jgi:hypothetical protein
MVIAGAVGTLALLLGAMHWHATLPATSLPNNQIPPLSSRAPLITHQAVSTLLSPNILVLLCSLRLEINQIGHVKLISTLIHSLALILNKTFTNATAVLYATQQMTQQYNAASANLLSTTFSRPFTLVVSLMTVGVTGAYLGGVSISIPLLLTLALSISTSYLATYEQLFISQSATNILLAPNIATLIILVILSQLSHSISSTSIIGIFFVLRLFTAFFLSYIAAQRWKISPLLHSKSFFIAGSLGVIMALSIAMRSLVV